MAKSSFPKADAAALAFFRDLVPAGPTVTTRPMFGHVGAFVNGTMFMGVFGDRVLVRLDETDRKKLLAEDGAGPFAPIAGRPMGQYVLLPADWQDDPDEAKPWVERSLAYAAALPPRQREGRQAPKTPVVGGGRCLPPTTRALLRNL